VLLLAATLGACDFLSQQDDPPLAPPFVHAIAANVGPTTPLPIDGAIQIAFDRYLNPSTVNRQGIGLRDTFGNAPDSPIVDYDPITRVVTLLNPNPSLPWLTVGTPYEVVFPIATNEAGSFGLRAIDGASIDPTTQSIAFTAIVGTGTPFAQPHMDFCSDVMPIFSAFTPDHSIEGACGSANCHGVPEGKLLSAQGLVLDTNDGILHTAIGVQAEEATIGGTTTPLASQAVFPVGMPIIDPGNPGDSFLIYKLLKEDNGVPDASGATVIYRACNPITAVTNFGPSASDARFASPDEGARLANLVVGRRMPWGDKALSIDEMERIRLWIAQGATVDDCSMCPATQSK
jgi:hypothetical protein